MDSLREEANPACWKSPADQDRHARARPPPPSRRFGPAMMQAIGFAIMVAAAITALSNWRLGLHAAILTAIVQDPVRKLMPGEPIYYILVAGAVFGVACVAAMSAGVRFNPDRVFGWRRFLAAPANLFVVLLAMQAVQGFVRTGSPVVVGIGLLSYLTPVPAIMFAYQVALRGGAAFINRLLVFYAAITGVALCTIVLEFLGVSSPMLGEVGPGLTIYDLGTVLQANSGIYRASEIAAWHAATCASFILLILTVRKPTLVRVVIAVLLIGAVLWIGVLTGRRKVLAEFILFACSYFSLLALLLRGGAKMALGAALVGLVAYLGAVNLIGGADEAQQAQDLYLARGQTVFGDFGSRFAQLGLDPIFWAYQRFGLLGGGLGLGSQGAQNFGAQTQGAAEGGLGKITVELGIPGLLCLAWLAISLFRQVNSALRFTARRSPALAPLQFGLAGLLIANIGTFSVATQVYGDITVLLLLGSTLGFVLAVPVLAEREAVARQAKRGHSPVQGSPARRAAAVAAWQAAGGPRPPPLRHR